MKNDHYLYKMSDKQLAQFRSKLVTQHTELGWKAEKLTSRLHNRKERDAKRRAAIHPTQQLLNEARIIHQALLPLGLSEALTLVENQIATFEATIATALAKYRLLSSEEIALKEMEICLVGSKQEVIKLHLDEVELELAARALQEVSGDVLVPEMAVEVVEVVEVVEEGKERAMEVGPVLELIPRDSDLMGWDFAMSDMFLPPILTPHKMRRKPIQQH